MSRDDAHSKSLELVPYTCGPVKDVLIQLKDKYDISDSDFEFAYGLLTKQTCRLRRALVKQIEMALSE